MSVLRFIHSVLFVLSAGVSAVSAQGTQVAFGTVQDNSGLPVEVTSENLSVDENTGIAIFTNNVVAIQGEMRLSSDRLDVFYNNEAQAVERFEATGNVILISGPDAAEAEWAEYIVGDGRIVMKENVLVSQGPSTITSDEMVVFVDDGTAQMTGNVKTVFQTGDQ